MKYLIYLIVVASIAIVGCASDQNYGQENNGRGGVGTEFYEEYGTTNPAESLPPNYPAFAPGNQFGPRRDFP